MSIPAPGSVAVDWWSFEFDTVRVPALSTAGVPYTRKVWTGMPRIPAPILDSVFYLYRSREDAEAGEDLGGTGFFLGVPLEGPPGLAIGHYIYAITNWHVAVNKGCSVVRVNKYGGGVDIFELEPHEWEFIPGGPDIAVADVNFDQKIHKIVFLSSQMIASPKFTADAAIGPGDDIFMIGRFMDHDGGEENVPAVRFGHVSVSPQKIEQRTGARDRGSYILDIHSRSGYSGSPVFVYRTPFTNLQIPNEMVHANVPYSRFIALLGMHWGQFPERWEIGTSKEPFAHAGLPANARYVEGWSGMSLAVPAYEILEVLNMPKLKSIRDASAAEARAKMKPREEVAQSASEDSNPEHRADFKKLLSEAVKAPPEAG